MIDGVECGGNIVAVVNGILRDDAVEIIVEEAGGGFGVNVVQSAGRRLRIDDGTRVVLV